MKFGLVGLNEHSLPFVNTPFSPKSPLSEEPLCHLIWIFVYNLAILAFNRHFCHFRQNRHFPKGHFANSFEFVFTVWRFWRLSPFLSFLPNTPFSPKSPLSKGPLCHLIWIFVHSLAILAINRHFCRFHQCVHFWTYLITRLRLQNFERTNFYLCNPFIQTTSRNTLFCSKMCTYPPVLAGSV